MWGKELSGPLQILREGKTQFNKEDDKELLELKLELKRALIDNLKILVRKSGNCLHVVLLVILRNKIHKHLHVELGNLQTEACFGVSK